MKKLNQLTKYFFVEACLYIEENKLDLTDYLKSLKNIFQDGLQKFKEIQNDSIIKCSFLIDDKISFINREIYNKNDFS